MSSEGPRQWAGLTGDLLELADAQQRALECGDVDGFAALVSERGPLQERVVALATGGRLPLADQVELQRVLEEVRRRDRATLALAQRILTATAEEIVQLRHGHRALRGYESVMGGRPRCDAGRQAWAR